MKIRVPIAAMNGYVPGEQPADLSSWIKLNTNENPYPPSPKCAEVLRSLDTAQLRLYPNPTADLLRKTIAERFRVSMDQVVTGNGSDDILNLAVRVFCDRDNAMAVATPSYSLYPALAQIQETSCRAIRLNADFSLPADFVAQLEGTNLLMIPSPNAPTGLPFPLEALRKICCCYSGAVLVDEAYADFSDGNAIDLLREFPNVIISRTFSKSYALAGLRVGFAIASPAVIAEFMKVKDSYNLGLIPLLMAVAAMSDETYLQKTVALIRGERDRLSAALTALGYQVIPSEANFIFASPPDRDGLRVYEALKQRKILIRYFKGDVTGQYVRITIGTPEQMTVLIEALRSL